MPYQIIDTHTHLDDDKFSSDLNAVLARAQESGVSQMVCVGSNFTSSRKAVGLAEEYEQIYAAVGVHPHDAKDVVPRTWDGLRLLCESSRVVAWGRSAWITITISLHRNAR